MFSTDVDYEVVSFEKNNATADKEGNAKVYVKITSRKNSDVKKEAVVDETYTIAKEYKNEFAIRTGFLKSLKSHHLTIITRKCSEHSDNGFAISIRGLDAVRFIHF